MGAAVLFSSNAAWPWSTTGGATEITAEALGAGGAGGDATNNPACCAGGKAGSYARQVITKGAETTLNITVGIGGTSATGVDGTASTIVQGGTTVVSGAGGAGVPANGTTGATGLIGSNIGTTTYEGGNGGPPNGTTTSGGGGGAAGPDGVGNAPVGQAGGLHAGTSTFLNGTHYCGTGGAGVAVRNAGNQGNPYGGAGAGGNTNQVADKLGGVGQNGVVVLTWTDVANSEVALERHIRGVLRGVR